MGEIIAIGTTKGLVVIFLPTQKRPFAMKIPEKDLQSKFFGSVTAIDISMDSKFLVSGYYGGQIILWDVETGHIVKKVMDQFSTPIDMVGFLRETNQILVASKVF